MTQKIFAIRDTKAGFYGQPFNQLSFAEAERVLIKLTQDKQTNVGQFPEDFDLYHLGEFDNITGKYEPLETPRHIVKAVNLVKNS